MVHLRLRTHYASTAQGYHPGVACDKTGQCPIIGWRFHLIGEDYDLCEAEFSKLPDAEKANYEKIAPPRPPRAAQSDAAPSELARDAGGKRAVGEAQREAQRVCGEIVEGLLAARSA